MIDNQTPAEERKPVPRRLTSRRGSIAIVVLITLFSGVVHGYLDGRWSHPIDLKSRGERLGDLPDRFGDWVLSELTPLDQTANKLLRCYGSQVRLYRNENTKLMINVAVLFGPRGPIAVHTPEVCYSSIGTNQVAPAQVQNLSTTTTQHQFWSVQFAQDSQPDPSIDVWYGWSDGGPWQASKYPRVWLTESLYKIQVAGPVSTESQQPCREFLSAFLPHLERVIQQ